MKRYTVLKIVKRDGAIEPFQLSKLRRCLAVVMREGGFDERLADALARAVAMTLQDWKKRTLPTSEHIFRCCVTVLRETEMGEVADRLEAHRTARAARIATVTVFDPQRPDRGAVRWRKAAVVKELENDYGISRSVARMLASDIEQRVVGLDYRVISWVLVREVIKAEVDAWGLGDSALARVAS